MYEELQSHLRELGYALPEVKLDGNIQRFDRNGKKNAWFLGFQNHTRKGDTYVVAKFGDWKTGDEETYQSNVVMSREDKKAVEGDIEKAKKKLETEREVRREEAAEEAADVWAQATENPASDYLKRKQISGLLGAKTTMGASGREVLVPCRDASGKLWGLQRIMPDGTKIFMVGQRKQSCFHTIPFADALETEDVVYIAEGFATAASIHEAIQKPVVVAFDSGNIGSVVKAIKEKWPDKAVLICGDDDRFTKDTSGLPINPGRSKAEEAATKFLGKAIFPVFKKDNGKLTDFNDLHLSEGLEAVRNIILGVKPEFHAVHSLGHQGDVYYFISSDNANVTSLSAGGFTKLALMSMMPLQYWETNYPSKQGGPSWDLAANALMRACRAKGRFEPKMIRGAGVWKDEERTVVNLGNGLWVDGEVLQYREFKSKYIYQVANKAMFPNPKFATTDEMNKLAAAMEMMSWKKEESAKLLLGWIMVAPICGALEWRPHVWITGPSGSGKSFVMNSVLSKIFGENALKVLGNTTEAGVRASVGSDARPLWFDEFETDDERSSERVKSVVELCRQASSETDAQVVKGSPNGRAITFTVRFAAVVSSIRPNLQHEQDKNRFALLELLRSDVDNFTGADGIQKTFKTLLTDDFIEKLFSRAVHLVDLILQNRDTFFDVMVEKYKGRFADQYGTLLAGYFAAVDDKPVTREMAAWALENFIKLEEQAESTDAHDELDCLSHLLDSVVRHDSGNMTIAELIEKSLAPRAPLLSGPDDAYQDTLMRAGVKVIDKDHVAIQFSNPELKRIYRGTKWAAGSSTAMKRIPGSQATTARFFGKVKKVVKLKFTDAE